MSTVPSGASVGDYAAVLAVECISQQGEHTLGTRVNALTKVYAFAIGEPLDQEDPGSQTWWRILAEALQQGVDLHPSLSKRQVALIEAQIELATQRGTPEHTTV